MTTLKPQKPFDAGERDALGFHLAFCVLCAAVLAAPLGLAPGPRLLILVVIYNAGLPLFALLRRRPEWLGPWLFAAILSVFQVAPDWFLSAQLNILVFPEDGLFKIGTVSGYMAGLWTIPLFVIVYTGLRIESRFSARAAWPVVALASLLIFGGSEQTLWILSSWYAVNVTMIGHVAVYIVLPEILLGLSAYHAYRVVRERSHWVKIPAAFIVMQLYLGSAAFFYFLFEKVLR
ncbi:MAG: DUF6989 domain-containing protein [Thermodesulfobacteriota bacterium]